MFELKSLGFAESEIFRVTLDKHGSLYVPIEWYNEKGYFSISTATWMDLYLNGFGLSSSNFPLVRERDRSAVYLADEVTLLDQTRPAGEITAYPRTTGGNVFGTIGAPFFGGGILAFDPAGPHVAVARHTWIPPDRGWNFHCLPHVGDSGLPLTRAIRLARAPRVEITTLLHTMSAHSYLTQELVDALPPKTLRKDERMDLVLPDGSTLDVALELRDSALRYRVTIDEGPIGVVLGIDVLRRCLSVFDFNAGRTWLSPYGP